MLIKPCVTPRGSEDEKNLSKTNGQLHIARFVWNLLWNNKGKYSRSYNDFSKFLVSLNFDIFVILPLGKACMDQSKRCKTRKIESKRWFKEPPKKRRKERYTSDR